MNKPLNIALFVLITAAIFIFAELVLALAFKVTGSSKFSVLEKNYPIEADSYLKIAIFGGSSAAGYNSERGFADIIKYELKRRNPQLKLYIKNYAQCGYPFHRHEAEIIKKVITKYDFFLIYAGHNEPNNYLDDVGYFKTARYKNLNALTPLKVDSEEHKLINFLESRSRVYVIIKKSLDRFLAWFSKVFPGTLKANQVYHYERFQEFESKRVLPEEEIVKISLNFKKDLQEIAELAARHNKKIIVSSVPVNESWKPYFSVHKEGLSPDDLNLFQKDYLNGLALYRLKEFNKAIPYLLKAYEIDQHVAILDYIIGYSYLMAGDIKKGREYLRQSADDDGFPIRALSSLSKIEKAVCQKYNSIYFVDSVESFYKSLDKGITYDELFSDLVHPSLLGHVIIANNFLCKLSDLSSLASVRRNQDCMDFNSLDPKLLLERYKKNLKISDKEESWNAFMIARWHISMAALSCYPVEILSKALDYINEFYKKSQKQPVDKATVLLFQALIECERPEGDREKIVSLANQSLDLSSRYIRNILYKGLATGELIVDIFAKKGVFLSEKSKKFYIKNIADEKILTY